MPNKPVVYSDHAEGRMRQRGFTRQHVRWLLAHGIQSLEPTLHGQQRYGRRGYLGRREGKVIYIENAERIVIVTVEWTDE